MADIVLDINNVSVEIGGTRLIENITLHVERGSTVAIIGPNGAGKTTLLRAVLGLVPLSSGSITLFGVPIASWASCARRWGMCPSVWSMTGIFP